MKTTLIAVAALMTLGACASLPARTLDPAAGSWEGWVKITGEEFELYADRDQVLQPFSRPCLSGALPRDLQRQAADLNGAQVRVTGSVTPWAAGTRTLDRVGSTITNACGGSVVILADRIAPV